MAAGTAPSRTEGTARPEPLVQARITDEPLDAAGALRSLRTDADGAVLLFEGVVRNHADGRTVTGMRYDAYVEMAEEVLSDIAREAALESGAPRIRVEHRIGRLAIGEASVVIASASPHRAESFDAVRYVIEEIKKRLPVWKKEEYVDGDELWVEGTRPPTPEPGGTTAEFPDPPRGAREPADTPAEEAAP